MWDQHNHHPCKRICEYAILAIFFAMCQLCKTSGVFFWLQVMNHQQQTGKFNFTTQFPHYREVLYKPDFKGRKLGKNVIFDMDMSPGDFLALFFLLKVPIEVINIKVKWDWNFHFYKLSLWSTKPLIEMIYFSIFPCFFLWAYFVINLGVWVCLFFVRIWFR